METQPIEQLITEMNIGLITVEDNHITDMNQAAAALLGIELGIKYSATLWTGLFAEEYGQRMFNDMLKNQGNICKARFMLRRQNDTFLWAEVSANQIKSGDGCLIQFMFQSIDKIIEYEQIKRTKDYQLEKTKNEFSRFIYSISHDFRAPLSTMEGLIYLRKIRQIEETDFLEKLGFSLKKVNSFIGKLIEVGQASSEGLITSAIHLKSLVDELIGDMTEGLDPTTISFKTKFSNELTVYSDKTKLKLVMFHVLKNTIDFRDSMKGKLLVTMVGTTKQGFLELEIIDNGIGIPMQHQSRVFDMFYRASDKSKGSGLGLFIAREAIAQLGGSIKIDSKEGVGTVVQIQVPKNPPC